MRKSTTRSVLIKSYVILAITVLVFAVFSKWSVGQYQTSKRAQDLYDQAAGKQEKASTRLGQIETRNQLLETHTGKEDVLVDRFAVKRPGERVLILVEEDASPVIIEQEKEPTTWERFKAWF